MLYKTLSSYHDNDPWDNNEEHPDGPLWLITVDELIDIPNGTLVEHAIDGSEHMKGRDALTTEVKCGTTEREYSSYGLRGWKNEL